MHNAKYPVYPVYVSILTDVDYYMPLILVALRYKMSFDVCTVIYVIDQFLTYKFQRHMPLANIACVVFRTTHNNNFYMAVANKMPLP